MLFQAAPLRFVSYEGRVCCCYNGYASLMMMYQTMSLVALEGFGELSNALATL